MIGKIRFIVGMLLMLPAFSFSQTAFNFKAYPNPFADTIHIQFNLSVTDTVSLTMYNLFGSRVDSTFNNTSLPPGSYSVKVDKHNLPVGIYILKFAGKSDSVLTKLVKAGSVTAIQEVDGKDGIVVFPNPAKEEFEVSSLRFEIGDVISVTDLIGRIVAHKMVTNTTFNIKFQASNYSPGVYFVHIHSVNGDAVKMMIKK